MTNEPPDSQRIPCRYCAAPLAASDVNVQLAIARCSSCNAVYSFADEARSRAEAPLAERPTVPLPKRFHVERADGVLTITRSWFSPEAFALLFFCVFWDGFLLLWFTISFGSGAWWMGLFATLHLLAGVAITYGTLAKFINKSVISVGGGRVVVKHGPLPVGGNLELQSAELSQLWCTEHGRRGNRSTSTTIEVHARTKSGKDHRLVQDLEEPEQALYLEQQIERQLRIADRRMAGEIERT